MLMSKAREKVRGTGYAILRGLYEKTSVKKRYQSNYLNEVRVGPKWNLMGKHLKQWNGKCRGHEVMSLQVCLRSKEMAKGAK